MLKIFKNKYFFFKVVKTNTIKVKVEKSRKGKFVVINN